MTLRDDILAQAGARRRLSYRLEPPPDGVTTIDCSLLVRDAVRAAGAGELPRTAEAQRQATVPIGFDDVQPGDLLFFEHTYKPDPRFNPPGPDGKTASHVGFSLGAHTLRMLDAHDERSNGAPDVSVTDISTDYWQEKIIEARRLPALIEQPDTGGDQDGLSDEPDHAFTLAELWPIIQAAGSEFGFDAQVLAGIIDQESTFHNYRVHLDKTGHGLLGLDDGGLLSDFERWSGLSIGRGPTARIIPVVPQIRYAAHALADYANRLGGPYAAARAWHRGEGLMNDARGQHYEQLIRGHVAELFAEGEPQSAPAEPEPISDPVAAQLAGLISAVAYLADDVAAIDDRDARVAEARRVREQFVGPRPAA